MAMFSIISRNIFHNFIFIAPFIAQFGFRKINVFCILFLMSCTPTKQAYSIDRTIHCVLNEISRLFPLSNIYKFYGSPIALPTTAG